MSQNDPPLRLSDLTRGQLHALFTSSINRHEELVRLRRREIKPRVRDMVYVDEPRLLDEAIRATAENITIIGDELGASAQAG